MGGIETDDRTDVTGDWGYYSEKAKKDGRVDGFLASPWVLPLTLYNPCPILRLIDRDCAKATPGGPTRVDATLPISLTNSAGLAVNSCVHPAQSHPITFTTLDRTIQAS